jgi:5-hydroxyisourate hydrolase-like protein (transthyretin family)
VIALALLLQLQVAGPVQVTGQVLRVVEGDSVPAASARVTLHRVGEVVQGAVDSTITGADGRFTFRARVDSGDVLLASARWHGVEYFAEPVVSGVPVRVMVADTSSTARVIVAARHVIIGGPAPDGARDVVDLIVLRNPGSLTRAVGDSAHDGSWEMQLPPLVANVQIGDADFAADAFDLHGDTLILFAPIPPGERQFFLQYQIAPGARSLRIPFTDLVDTVSILAEESNITVPDRFVLQGMETVSGRSFSRWSGAGILEVVEIEFPGDGSLPDWILPALVLLIALPLAWVTWRAVARR